MKELKEDKRKLEETIEHYVNEFCKKYGVKIENIDVGRLGYYNGDTEYKIEVDVRL